MSFKLGNFFKSYIKSMRLYYAFVTGIAGWIGVSFYHFCMPDFVDYGRSVLVLIVLFLSWGINQIVNDYLGLKEDRINAPNRPMVTGELNPKWAMILSGVLILGTLLISWQMNPWSVIPVLAGVLLNVLYEYSKAWSLLGNVVFGVSIASCTGYGFLASGPLPEPVYTTNRLSVLILVAVLNGLMTYFTYFKDVQGDQAVGKKTFIVRHGLKTARWAGILGAFLPTLAFFMFMIIGWLPPSDILFKEHFVFCGVMTVFLQFWTAVLYWRHPGGERTYFSLATNIRACVAGQVALIAIFNGTLALYLLSACYIFIGFLFDLYKDARA
ncbi:MAG: ubiquinone biosynthesis protein UbiA [Desulfobacteraceae bacterium]|nr:MAG: ubiquinone biosynthesis protein UbiA [Desulfobacteraceae bacterium]